MKNYMDFIYWKLGGRACRNLSPNVSLNQREEKCMVKHKQNGGGELPFAVNGRDTHRISNSVINRNRLLWSYCEASKTSTDQAFKICVPKFLKENWIKLKDNAVTWLAFEMQWQGNKSCKMQLKTLI